MSSLAIERKLISCLVEQAAIKRVWEMGLRSSAFEDPVNRRVFEWMMDYWQEAQMRHAPTWVVMETEFPSVPLQPEVEEPVDWLVGYLKNRYLVNLGQKAIRLAAENLSATPMESLGELWRSAYEITQETAPRFSRADMAATVAQRRERYTQRNRDVDYGITLGLAELDEHTRGVLPGELVAAAAYTKTGKTWLLANAAASAHKTGHRPLVMTLEQTIPEMQERIDAVYSGVSYSRLSAGELTFKEYDRLLAAQEELASTGPLWVERPPRGERTIKNMCSRARELGSDYLILDQLSFIDAEREYRGDRALTQKHGDLVFELKDEISRDSAGLLPCLLAVQLNRDSVRDRRNGGRGGLHNFANSTMIEQTVDLALGLWRNEDMRSTNLMGLDIMGSRRCDLKSWLLDWQLDRQTLFRIEQEYTE